MDFSIMHEDEFVHPCMCGYIINQCYIVIHFRLRLLRKTIAPDPSPLLLKKILLQHLQMKRVCMKYQGNSRIAWDK